MKDIIEIFNQLVPYVIEQTGRGERGMDIYSRLLRESIIFIGMPIDDHVASLTIGWWSTTPAALIHPPERFPTLHGTDREIEYPSKIVNYWNRWLISDTYSTLICHEDVWG